VGDQDVSGGTERRHLRRWRTSDDWGNRLRVDWTQAVNETEHTNGDPDKAGQCGATKIGHQITCSP